MTGPLAQQFAQVREALDEICPQEYVIDCDLPEHQTARDGHAALSAIERHVQDMETALRGLLVETEPEQHRGTEPHPERGMCVWCDARAALAGPDTPADRQPEEPT